MGNICNQINECYDNSKTSRKRTIEDDTSSTGTAMDKPISGYHDLIDK